MKRQVFLDSGIFIALLNRHDQYHAPAAALVNGPTPNWVTSMGVISESYSLLLHRLGEDAARKLRFLIEQMSGLQRFDLKADDHPHVCTILDRMRGARLTYVDASSLWLMQRHKIKTAWSTDHHLGLLGAEVLPRS